MVIDEKQLIREKDLGVFHYVTSNKVYFCFFYDGEIWIKFDSISGISGLSEDKLTETIDYIYSRGYLNEENTHKYYFNDGNTRGYKSGDKNFYNLSMVVAISIKSGSFALWDFISWAHATTNDVLFKRQGPLPSLRRRNAFVYINFFSHSVQDVIVPHKHNCYELVYYTEGRGKTACEGGVFEYKSGTLFVVKPYEMHEEYVLEPSKCYCLAFNTDFDLPTCVIYGNAKNENDVNAVCEYIREIDAAAKGENTEREIESAVILVSYLINKLTNTSQKENRSSDATVDYVKKYLDLNYSYRINFTILADRIGYSASHLNYLFKRKEGVPMYAYLNNVRLLKAKQLLREREENVSQIGKKCGFASESRFSQFFKEKTGVSPQVYRHISNEEIENGVLLAGKIKRRDS